MSLSPRCYALSQITSLVASISRKNFKINQAEIEKLIEIYGPDADKHLFRCLVSSVDFSTDGRNLGKDGQQLQLLIQEANALVTKPNFVSILCYAFEKQENVRPSQQLFSQLAKVLKLTKVQEVVFALGLKKSSDSDLLDYASQHLKVSLPELVRSYSDFSSGLEGGLAEVAIEVLHLLLSHLLESPEDEVGVNADAVETFVRTMRQDFPRDRVPVVLAPLLYREQQDITEDRLVPVSVALPSSVSSINLAEIIKEVGYTATASKQDMLEILKDYGKTQINTKQVARVLGMMASTLTNLPESVQFMGVTGDPPHFTGKPPTTWDIRVFVQALQSLLPNLNWREIILYLDYPEFYLSSPEGLNLIVNAFKLATRDTFPVECIYLTWRNTRGHLSLLKQAIVGCPEFSVAQYPMVVMQLTDEHKFNLNSEEAKTWRSLSLIESLLRLSEHGHYEEVLTLLYIPMSKCPEILFLGLIKAKMSASQHEPFQWWIVQHEVVNQILPVFIANHPTYSPVLYDAWHSSNSSPHVQQMMVQAISNWCYQTDPPDSARIARVLEVAKDLKIIMAMVNTDQFPFVIELAAFAAKRDFLNLDKWVTDKMKIHQEVFVNECVQLLMARAPKALSQQGSERMGFTHDIVTAILSSLQPCIGTVKADLGEKLRALINIHGPLPPKPRSTPSAMGLPTTPLDLGGGGGGLSGLPFFGHGSSTTPLSPKTSSYGASSYGGQQPPMQGAFPQMEFGGMQFGGVGGAKHAHPGLQLQQQQLQQQQQQQQLSQQANKPMGDPILLGPEQVFSKDVDDKANAYFQAIYNRGMNVDRLLELLKQFKDSINKKERDLFVCMLRNMFEEYKFFPQFPEKELQITGQLFGGIIEHGLVTYMSLSLALRYVLDSLKKVPGTKMYLFGIAALDKFKTRLHEFPQYCASISAIPHYQNFPNYLKQYIQFGQQSIEPPPAAVSAAMTPVTPVNPFGLTHTTDPGSPMSIPGMLPPINTNRMPPAGVVGGTGSSPLASPVTTPSGQLSPSLAGVGSPLGASGSGAGSVKSSAGSPLGAPKRDQTPSINTASIDTLLVAADQQQAPPPPEELQDRIHFLFNNLSASNLSEKTEEFKGLVSEEHLDWVAQYLVMKRVSIEANFHSLYINFMDTLGSTQLKKMVLRETYRNIKVILRADKTTNNFSDRAVLKNLGHWLGMQTLAKNKAILQNDLAVKDLVREAHYKGEKELFYVVPFVAKVLESCADSKIFKPPNPWTMAILTVLSELHAIPDLKLNLRFEVEVLCKHLNMEIVDIPPSTLLKDTEGAKNFHQLSPPSATEQPSPDEGMGGAVQGGPLGGGVAVGPGAQPVPPQPLFHPDDINVQSLAGLTPHLQINPQIALLQKYPHLKQYIKPAVEKAVQDLLVPVAERSIKIALTTTEHIIRKDFSLDPDIHRMHMAAHHMVRHLTAGMALITCREPLLLSISTNLKSTFSTALRAQAEELKPLIDQAAHQISAENTELACAFIQKTSMEKATPEMDKRLAEEFELRKQARNEGRRYCNTSALTYQAERMPEQIRLNVGGPTSQQATVYEEFSRCLPGFLPSSAAKDGVYAGKTEFVPNEEFLQILLKCIQEISQHLRVALAPHNNPHILMMRALLEMTMQLRISQSHQNVISLLQKALEGLLEGMNPPPSDPDLFVSFRDCHLLILKMVQGHSGLGPETAMYHVTRILLSAREDIKYSPRAIILLIGMQIVDMKLLDEHLAKAIENGRNLVPLSCSIKLVNAIVSAEKRETPITDKDLLKTKETLYRLAANVKLLPDSSAQLLEPFRINHDIQLMSSGGIIVGPGGGSGFGGLENAFSGSSVPHPSVASTPGHTSELEDPPGLYEKVEYLLSEWVRHFHQPGLLREGDKIYAAYVARLQQQGILKSDDLITRFFRISVEMCVDLCYRTINDPSINASMARAKCYHTMDAFVKLVVVLVRYSGDTANVMTKVNLLNKVLVTVATVLHHDHESKHAEFHQLAYHRFFIMLLSDLCMPDPVFDTINFPVLHTFCQVYHIIRPSRAPGFAYSWLELISHRVFIAKLLLQTPQQKGWPLFHQLLIDLFKFLAPFLRNAELTKPTQLLYKGTLRVLLVLLHDFPEFLCDYHFSFCDVIPPNCIQMRNLILSAFPRNMRLPDPFTPNLKVEMLPDIAHAPRIIPNFSQHIPAAFKKDLDNYIRTRAPVTFLQELRGHLTVSSEPGNQYSVSLMNSLVLYVGTQAIAFIHNKGNTPSTSTIAHSAHMDIFQHLVVDLDTEGRYLFLNAIANQLRYPNSHTHYFSCALLSLFAETNAEAIQEQITRVLLERLIVNRPHPWGLLITFIELIKNPTYNFWKHEFVHCAPEIEKLFGSVAKSCMQKLPQTGIQRDEGVAHEIT